MEDKSENRCPLFPDLLCPRGEEASHACSVRVNGDFDPVLYFKDQLLLHCALHRNQQRLSVKQR
jgi:hypothetical protein